MDNKEEVIDRIIGLVCTSTCTPCLGRKCLYIQGDWANGKAQKILSLVAPELKVLDET